MIKKVKKRGVLQECEAPQIVAWIFVELFFGFFPKQGLIVCGTEFREASIITDGLSESMNLIYFMNQYARKPGNLEILTKHFTFA